MALTSRPVSLSVKDFEPGKDRVLVKVEAVQQTSSGLHGASIHLPEQVQESQRPARGVVMSVGPETKQIKVGDYVVFMMYAGTILEDLGDGITEAESRVAYRVVREPEIYGRYSQWKYTGDEGGP